LKPISAGNNLFLPWQKLPTLAKDTVCILVLRKVKNHTISDHPVAELTNRINLTLLTTETNDDANPPITEQINLSSL